MPGRGKCCLSYPKGPPSLLFSGHPGAWYAEVKWPVREANHCPPSNVEVKNQAAVFALARLPSLGAQGAAVPLFCGVLAYVCLLGLPRLCVSLIIRVFMYVRCTSRVFHSVVIPVLTTRNFSSISSLPAHRFCAAHEFPDIHCFVVTSVLPSASVHLQFTHNCAHHSYSRVVHTWNSESRPCL
jgi:hypothetical protein